MTGKVDDPNEGLADDAVLATDLGDEDERRTEQLAYYGGDGDEIEVDEADRGDVVIPEDDDGEEADDADEPEEEPSGDDDDADEAEAEAVDESDDDDSEGDEEPASKPDKGIPRHRFNEVNQRMREAEAENASLKAEREAGKAETVDKFDFDAAEEEYMGLLLDGKTKDASAARRVIREAEKAEFKAEAKAETMTEVDSTHAERVLNALTTEAENLFPQFDAKAAEFDPAIVAKTVTFMRGYQAQGETPDEAFISALADAIEFFGLDDTESPGDVVTPKTGKTVTKKDPIRKVKEKIAASKKAVRPLADAGQGSADAGTVIPDIDQMSEDELDALPESMLARMRGDIL